jgi:hypothetical protein
MLSLLIFVQCEENEDTGVDKQIDTVLPSNFKVDIPDALSNTTQLKSASLKSTTGNDTIKGQDVYKHMNHFIHIGETAADVVNEIIQGIVKYDLGEDMEVTYTSNEDSREKRLVVEENVSFEDNKWEHQLTIYDVESEGNEDEGKAMQVFWNSDPINGIALIKPYNLDRDNNAAAGDAMYRINYSEKGENGYNREMMVYIESFPHKDADDVYHMTNFKLFAGKKDDYIDVIGTSIHPDAYLFIVDQTGLAWTFIGSSDREADKGVAQVSLPPHKLDEPNRATLLETYSMYNVMYSQAEEIIMNKLVEEYGQAWVDRASEKDWFQDTLQNYIEPYMSEVKSPGYFHNGEFKAAGTAPSDDYNPLVGRLDALDPYNPKTVNSLSLSFK